MNIKTIEEIKAECQHWLDNIALVQHCQGAAKGTDRNTLDFTAPREDGHRILKSTTYRNGLWEGRCLKCGMYFRLIGQAIREWWS